MEREKLLELLEIGKQKVKYEKLILKYETKLEEAEKDSEDYTIAISKIEKYKKKLEEL